MSSPKKTLKQNADIPSTPARSTSDIIGKIFLGLKILSLDVRLCLHGSVAVSLLLFLGRVTRLSRLFKVVSQLVEATCGGFVVNTKLGADLMVVRSLE